VRGSATSSAATSILGVETKTASDNKHWNKDRENRDI